MNMKKKIKLIPFINGVQEERLLFEEDDGEILIGRSETNTVVLPKYDSYSSRAHGEIQISEGTVWVNDHSANGTWIDNQKISNQKCGLGTGEYTLRFGMANTADYFKLIIEDVVEEVEKEEEDVLSGDCIPTSMGTLMAESNPNAKVDKVQEPIVPPIEIEEPKEEPVWNRFGLGFDIEVVETDETPDVVEVDDFIFRIDDFLDKGNQNRQKDNPKENPDGIRIRSIEVGWGKAFKHMGDIKSGGFGFVKKVQNVKTGMTYALKEINAPDNPQLVKWFKREASIGQQLSHPRIVEVYDADLNDEQGIYRFLMEYCEGGDLAAWMKKHVKPGQGIPVKQAVHILLNILEGLEYLADATVETYDKEHNPIQVRGVVHRDIKPANIFLVKKDDIDSLKIGDLGTAKGYLSGDTKVVEHVRSDYYAPKKQGMRAGYSDAGCDVDVFAAAAIFYELLTGYKIRTNKQGQWGGGNPILPVSVLNPAVPERIGYIVDKILKEDRCMELDKTTSAAQFRREILREVQ